MSKAFAQPYEASMILNGLAERFWTDVMVGSDDACWLWKKSTASHCYGQTFDGNTVVLAHRVAYVLAKGPIPLGMTVDHSCYVRRCCNPNHLRLLTNLENARNNGASRRTHCPYGHAYDTDNTYVSKKGHRQCRQCSRRSKRDSYRRRVA